MTNSVGTVRGLASPVTTRQAGRISSVPVTKLPPIIPAGPSSSQTRLSAGQPLAPATLTQAIQAQGQGQAPTAPQSAPQNAPQSALPNTPMDMIISSVKYAASLGPQYTPPPAFGTENPVTNILNRIKEENDRLAAPEAPSGQTPATGSETAMDTGTETLTGPDNTDKPEAARGDEERDTALAFDTTNGDRVNGEKANEDNTNRDDKSASPLTSSSPAGEGPAPNERTPLDIQV